MNIASSVSRAAAVVALAAVMLPHTTPLAAQTSDPLRDYEVRPGFRLDVVNSGLQFPTAFAFVPEPGPGPRDPRLFITELHGRIKVVTNDGTIQLFADGFAKVELPAKGPIDDGETGAAGLCLDAGRGYVFVTYAYLDENRILRNGIRRFDATPGTFSLQPDSSRQIAPSLFASDTSFISHQIGPCQIHDDLLYVTVGDGTRPQRSHEPESTLGKLLRMTLDGRPAPGNPYPPNPAAPATAYLWAMGLRNMFSLHIVDGRVFGAENGTGIDRFLELKPGIDYGWDGTEWSTGMNAAMVFAPAVSPTQMEFYPRGKSFFPEELRTRFFMATAGPTGEPGPAVSGGKSILMIDFDFRTGRLRTKPTTLVRYSGNGLGSIVALAFGPDGLYYAPLFPPDGGDGTSPIIRVTFDPDNAHDVVLGTNVRAQSLMAEKGCLGCHALADRGGTAGPPLDPFVLRPKLESTLFTEAYMDSLNALNSRTEEALLSTRGARDAVAAAEGEDRIREWIVQRLLQPRFDMPNATMPQIPMTEGQALVIAQFLKGTEADAPSPLRKLIGSLPEPRYRFVVMAFFAGSVLSLVGMMIVARIRR